MYDIIGDIHGEYKLLVKLFTEMGYQPKENGFYHPTRKAIFIGDFINRGDHVRATVRMIKSMVEEGDAMAILGNHEFAAILYTTIDKKGYHLRRHIPKYKLPLMKTLKDYQNHEQEWIDTVKWMRTLPFFIEVDGIRIVHGGWSDEHIEILKSEIGDAGKLKKRFLKKFLNDKSLYNTVNRIMKGAELVLPDNLIVKDTKGFSRRKLRVKWWEPLEGKTFQQASFGNRFVLPDYTIPKEITFPMETYPDNAPIVFMGHYCLKDTNLIIRDNICCVDNCVIRNNKLTAYRWSGEKKLDADHLFQIEII